MLIIENWAKEILNKYSIVALPLSDNETSDLLAPLFGDRIVGGEATTIDKFPYQISLQFLDKHICGGSLISLKHVVTAGHCILKASDPIYYDILAGSTTHTGDGHAQLRDVERLVIHPEYNSGATKNDIAIIFVENEFNANSFVQPISLPEYESIPNDGTAVVVSGLIIFQMFCNMLL